MRQQFRFLGNDLRKNAGMVVWFIAEITVTFLYLAVLSSTLLSTQEYLNFLEHSPVISFHNCTGSGLPLSVTPNLDKTLTRLLAKNSNAYSVIPNLHPEGDDTTNIVVGLGKFEDLFGLHSKSSAAGHEKAEVLLGANVCRYRENDEITLGTFALRPLRVTGELPRGSAYADIPSGTMRSLDSSIVILTTWDNWKNYNTTDYTMQILQNMVLVGSPPEEATDFAQCVSRETQRMDLVPVGAAEDLAKRENYTQQGYLFLLFFISIAVMLGMGLTANLMRLVESNLPQYAVHRLYGATLANLYLRTTLYCCVIVLLPALAARLILGQDFSAFLSPWILPSVSVLLAVAASVYPVTRLKHWDMTEFLRGDA